jgi:spore coat protein CotF
MQLSQKEKMLLEDLKSHEQMVIQKCNDYANQAQDPQLEQLFQSMVQQEQQHIQKISQKLNQTPAQEQAGQVNQKDAMMCHDMLSSKKYLSSVYNTAIFEIQDKATRQELNAIQSEKQKLGEEIFNYMQNKGMYQVH